MNANLKRGFTLIEILVVIGIIAILAAIVIIAINPAKQFAQARNSQRTANVSSILNAIGQRMADNKGVFAGAFTIGGTTYTCPSLPTAIEEVCTASASCPTGGIDFSCLVPTYIPIISSDPGGGATTPDTGYTVVVDAAGRVTICAPAAAGETSIPNPTSICVTR
jgi:type IV pilus assembly protein PilA